MKISFRFDPISSSLLPLAFAVLCSAPNVDAALVPISRLSVVTTSETVCGLGCFSGEDPPFTYGESDTYTNASLDQTINTYNKVLTGASQHSSFTGSSIHVELTAYSPSVGSEFGSRSVFNSFLLEFSLTEDTPYHLSGALVAGGYGYGIHPHAQLSLNGPLDLGYELLFGADPLYNYDQPLPVDQSGVLPAGTYQFSIATRSDSNSVESSGASASIVIQLTPVPLPAPIWLFISVLMGSGIIAQLRKS